MTRLRRIADRDRIFFITTNVARTASPLTPAERDLLLDRLQRQHDRRDFLLFAYVVMPDHVHLLISPQRRGLSATMHEFKRMTAEKLLKLRGNRGSLWQARYFDFILRRVGDFWEKLEYIHQNPVEAKIADRPEEWRWSSASHYAGSGEPLVPVDEVNLPADKKSWLYPAPWRTV